MCYIAGIEAFDSDGEADKRMKAIRERRLGAATFNVTEVGTWATTQPPGKKKKQGGYLAEGVTLSVGEIPRFKK